MEHSTREQEPPKQRRVVTMSAVRLSRIKAALAEKGYTSDAIGDISATICEVLKFDPENHMNADYMRKYIQEKAQRLQLTTYEVSGRKAAYYRNKQANKNT